MRGLRAQEPSYRSYKMHAVHEPSSGMSPEQYAIFPCQSADAALPPMGFGTQTRTLTSLYKGSTSAQYSLTSKPSTGKMSSYTELCRGIPEDKAALARFGESIPLA